MNLAEIKAAAEAGPPIPAEGERALPCQLMGPNGNADRIRKGGVNDQTSC